MAENKPAVLLIEAVYPYQEIDKTIVVEKVRQVGKKFSIRKPNGDGTYIYKGAAKDLTIPLYNLPDVSLAQSVYIVEGEKDVETLRGYGLVATCNFDGAGKWKDHYSKALANKDIIVLPDNDSPGQKHAQLVTKKLQAYCKSIKVVELPGLKEHGDVTDYLASGSIESLLQLVDDAEFIEIEQKAKADQIPSAQYHDYVALYESILGDIKRDIFTNDLHFPNEFDQWEPCANALEILASEAATSEDCFHMKFKKPLLTSHMAKYERTKAPELLINVPQWDGIDRIKLFADCLIPSKDSPLSSDDFDQLISDWICKMYRRIFDPTVRNRILVLKGPQNIGKDWWQDSLLCGLGQFMEDLTVVSGDKDSYLALSRCAALKIAEFEKTAKTEISIIKDMVTKPFTVLRAPYGTGAKKRWCRSSFISSSNNSDLLRDSTGSTRFIIFDLERIEYKYPVRSESDGLQLLAQAKMLSENNFKSDKDTEERLAAFLFDRTPDDPSEDVLESYSRKIDGYLATISLQEQYEIRKKGWISTSLMIKLIKEIAEECDLKERTVRVMLRVAGFGTKRNGIRGYLLPNPSGNSETLDEIPF